jgi:hypothetical protein
MSPEDRRNPFGPGALLGDRYRLERRIASGGMATVWLAHDEELRRRVAIKVLSDVLAEDPAYTERFRREARVAAGLSNPNLVRIFDYSARSERPYIAMEYVEGGTLADRIAEGKADDLDTGRLARELLGALGTIHAAGVIHRDVKPSNVLLDRDGAVRLTDFGIARPENATDLTGTGQVLGTLKYMAPEVLAGNPATERSDLYSTGVLLGESLGPASSPELVALVDRLTADDPSERPASAEEAVAVLETAPSGAIPTAPMPEPSAHVVELSGRRILAALVALALIGGIVAIAVASGGSDPSTAGNHGEKPASAPTDTATATETATTTSTETTISSTTETVAPPAEPAPSDEEPPKAEKPPKDEKLPPGQAKKEE